MLPGHYRRLQYQMELFWLALSFFSRLPIPRNTPYSSERMNHANRYFALVGLLLGALCALIYVIAQTAFSAPIAVLLTMLFSLLLTGAFHEDGMADMADGIGGGMSVERRLEIMKDSRIGTYGASALVMALLAKFILLSEIAATGTTMSVAVSLIVAYTSSRTFAASFIYDMPYVSEANTSKSKPLASRQSQGELAFLLACGALAPMMFGIDVALVMIGVLSGLRAMFKRWLMSRIGGFTGDCLGAAQQIGEMVIYLVLLALPNALV
ncbi:adenosylcobinamide-GDP ribazoletransferase [Vibrio sp. SM6]|uniref:Adenosylcobinamide-GDP ribazoletransferase n=1 Tax=Vibrio agarilyticus TaxID=2726741 RepID=A0A7X8TQ87_9VIBR|nr:adenosylcobinamide-GDP ribazoletransferase [Vibrio agarilyticus]NLS12935.1 adenosylcobinamide-GDP ribazoletransferase [Vibrio agarilyticus]